MKDDLGKNIEELYQSFRKIKKFSDDSHLPENIEAFMHYSIQQSINHASCPSDFDSLVIKDQLDNIKQCYSNVESSYNKRLK